MSKKIAVDLDGVVFDTERYFRVFTEIADVNQYGLNNVRDNREVRFQDRYNWSDDFAEKFYAKNVYDFEIKSGLLPGVKEVLYYLKDKGYKLYIITARGFFSKKQISLTIKLLKEYNLDIFEKIIFKSKEKKDMIIKHDIDYMIDDNLSICKSIKDVCKVIYFKDGPSFDANDDKIITVHNWGEIYRYFYDE